MKTQTTVGLPKGDYQSELISIYQEHALEILKIMKDYDISYRPLGKDQSQRLVYEITYQENQLSNIQTLRKGISELERSNHLTDLILTGIRRLLS